MKGLRVMRDFQNSVCVQFEPISEGCSRKAAICRRGPPIFSRRFPYEILYNRVIRGL